MEESNVNSNPNISHQNIDFAKLEERLSVIDRLETKVADVSKSSVAVEEMVKSQSKKIEDLNLKFDSIAQKMDRGFKMSRNSMSKELDLVSRRFEEGFNHLFKKKFDPGFGVLKNRLGDNDDDDDDDDENDDDDEDDRSMPTDMIRSKDEDMVNFLLLKIVGDNENIPNYFQEVNPYIEEPSVLIGLRTELCFFTKIKKTKTGKIDRAITKGERSWKNRNCIDVRDSSGNIIGKRICLCYTDCKDRYWIMYEYQLSDEIENPEKWVVCVLKRGRGMNDNRKSSELEGRYIVNKKRKHRQDVGIGDGKMRLNDDGKYSEFVGRDSDMTEDFAHRKKRKNRDSIGIGEGKRGGCIAMAGTNKKQLDGNVNSLNVREKPLVDLTLTLSCPVSKEKKNDKKKDDNNSAL